MGLPCRLAVVPVTYSVIVPAGTTELRRHFRPARGVRNLPAAAYRETNSPSCIIAVQAGSKEDETTGSRELRMKLQPSRWSDLCLQDVLTNIVILYKGEILLYCFSRCYSLEGISS
jgi:hypothetical protein